MVGTIVMRRRMTTAATLVTVETEDSRMEVVVMEADMEGEDMEAVVMEEEDMEVVDMAEEDMVVTGAAAKM